jgi:hypothetical protein
LKFKFYRRDAENAEEKQNKREQKSKILMLDTMGMPCPNVKGRFPIAAHDCATLHCFLQSFLCVLCASAARNAVGVRL